MINAKTEIYAILGDPISHSMSPVIMNSSFQRFRMNKVFLAFQANLDNFQQIMTATKLIGLQGYVFTMPVKEAALSFMDELSEEDKHKYFLEGANEFLKDHIESTQFTDGGKVFKYPILNGDRYNQT